MVVDKPTRLTRKAKTRVTDALLNAFPDLPSFSRILDKLDKNINDFTGRDDTRDTGISKVIDVADRQLWASRLLDEIQASEWGSNPEIVQLAKDYPKLFSGSATRSGSPGRRATLSDVDLTALVRTKYLARPYCDITVRTPDDLAPYARLFRHLIASSTFDTQAADMFFRVARLILSSNSQYPLRIDGNPGSGKSSFLSLLYLALEYVSCHESGPFPFYIDLHRFDTAHDAQKTLGEHLKFVTKALGKRVNGNAILLVDGIDDYTPHAAHLEQTILSFITKNPEIKKVVGIGLSSVTDKPLFGSSVARSGEPEHTILLRGLPLVSERYKPFIQDFFAIQQSSPAATEDEFLNKLTMFRLSDIDLLTISLLLQFHRKAIRKPLTLSDLYEQYCRSVLGDDLNAAALLAYRFTVNQELPPSEAGPWNPAWRLIHWHTMMRDFLVAWHIHEVLNLVAAGDLGRLPELDHVYPYQISRFSKEMVTSNEQAEIRFLTALEVGFDKAGTNARSHMAYLAGRVTKFGPRKRARQMLTKWRDDIADPIATTPMSSEADLLLARTIYISLVDLGDQKSRDEYLELLVDNRNWNDLNRGFHLEYYGDLSYSSLTHRDPVTADWTRTYGFLFDKVSQDQNHTLFEVEVFTLFSLAQHRQAKEILTDEQRTSLRDVASRLLRQGKVRSSILRQYLTMVHDHLEKQTFRIGSVAEKLYRLKKEARKGWETRHLKVGETVAEHVFGTLLLGTLYLPPDNSDWEGYDKRKILRILFAHDLAEAITGDIINKSDDEQEKEREAYEYLGLLGTYESVEGARDLYRSFQEFDQRASLNARIAHDIDRLENLMQLYLFREHFDDVSEFQRFKIDLINEIETPAGQRIMQIIQDNFEDT
jgi:5'-deoxynucleotidase YfbR-like HD superfamily hydrolase